jgi:FtsX-like permease family
MDVGRVIRDGDLLVLDPTAASNVSTIPVGSDAHSLSSTLEAMAVDAPERSLLPLDGAPLRLGLTVDARLRSPKGSVSIPVGRDARGISVAVVVLDADGRLQRFAEPDLALLRGAGQRLEIPLSATASGIEVTPAFPLKVMAVDITVSPPLGSELAGTIDLTDVAVSSSASGEDWTSVPFDPASLSWRFEDAELGSAMRIPQASDVPGRIEIGVGSSDATLQGEGTETDPTTFRLWATPEHEVVPVVASDEFLRITGAKVGDEIGISVSQEPLKVHIVGGAELFPTLDPTRPSLIASSSALEIDRMLDGRGSGSLTTEWWLTASPDREGEVASLLTASPYSAASVISRAAITHSLQSDPVALGFVGALALGAIAAICFAALGFLVSTVVSTRERLGEFALLRALGMSGRQLSGWLSFEEASMLIVGLATGIALGLLLAWLVLPFATLNASGGAVIPSPVIVMPWQAVALAAFLAAALLGATVLVVARQVRRLPIVDVLRARDE